MRKLGFRMLTGAALLALLLCGCAPKQEQATVSDETGETFLLADNDAMTPETKQEIAALQTAFETAVQKQDAKALMSSLHEEFGATEDQMKTFLGQIAELPVASLKSMDEYYKKGLTVGDETVRIKKAESDTTSIQINPGSEEIDATLYTIGDKTLSRVISLTCAKMDGKWRIVWIDLTDYQYQGEDATVIYARAKEFYEAGKLMPAYLNSLMVSNLLIPGRMLRYANYTEMEDFIHKMESEVWKEHSLPLTLDGFETGVAIQTVGLSKNAERGIVPMILYTTKTPTKDRTATEREANQVLVAVEKLYPKTTESFPAIEVNATNEDPKKEGFSFETVLIEKK